MIYLKEKREHLYLYRELLKENTDEEGKKNTKECCSEVTALEKERLMCKVTLDKRLNTKDLKLYIYIMNFNHLYSTQEEIADLLDMSRSNVNKSLEKLTAFNYIKKYNGNCRAGRRTVYKIIQFSEAGICKLDASSLIRMVNVTATKKYNYYSLEDVRMMEQYMADCKSDIKILNAIINEDNPRKINMLIDGIKALDDDSISRLVKKMNDDLKNKGHVTGKLIVLNIDLLEANILDTKEKLKDFYYIRNSIETFRNKFYSTTKLDITKEEVEKVLNDDNMFMSLFLDKNEDENIVKFKEKYLEDYIKFLNKFTTINENKNFFKLLYENKGEFKFTVIDLMRLCKINHREAPSSKQVLDKRVEETLNELRDKIFKILENENYCRDEEIRMLLNETSELRDYYDILRESTVKKGDEEKEIDVEQLEEAQKNMISLIYILNLDEEFENAYKISIDDYADMFNSSLTGFMNRVNKALYSFTIMKKI